LALALAPNFGGYKLMLRFLPVPAKIVVLPESPPTLHPSIEQEVEEVWQAARERRGSALFNGSIFSLEEITPQAISGRYVEYRLYLAQELRPELFIKLRVQPLAVTGVLQNSDGLFLGYRNSGVAVQPNCWELIPSGGVDSSTLMQDGRLCAAKQILTELQEEVGISGAVIAPPQLLYFTEDPRHHIFELIWELRTLLERDAILHAHSTLLRPEHSEIRCVPWVEVDSFLEQERAAVLPATRELLEQLSFQKDPL
jgi:hypothetical protein